MTVHERECIRHTRAKPGPDKRIKPDRLVENQGKGEKRGRVSIPAHRHPGNGIVNDVNQNKKEEKIKSHCEISQPVP